MSSEFTRGSSSAVSRAHGIIQVILVAVAASLLLLPFTWRLGRSSFHLDETSWILVSERVVRATFVDRNFESPDLTEYGFSFGWPNPPAGKYLIGASVALRSLDHPSELHSTEWATYDRPILASIATHQTPPIDILVAARLPMAILGAATCLLVGSIGSAAWGPRTGCIAAAALALNPLMLVCCRRAMVDAPALFFSVLAVRLAIGFDHACSPGRLALTRARARGKVGAAAAIGAALALAVSSKFNALAVVAACAAILFVDAAAGGGLKARAAVAGVAAIVATAVFIALNPYLYADPLGRTWSMLSYQHNQPAITGVAERVLLVLRRLLAGEIDPQGLSYLTIRSMIRLPLEWVLFPVALVSAARALLREISGMVSRAAGGTIDENRSGAATSVLIWWIITTAAVAAWLPQDWERYYLPALPPTVLLSARGLDKAIGWALPLFRGIWLRPAGAS